MESVFQTANLLCNKLEFVRVRVGLGLLLRSGLGLAVWVVFGVKAILADTL